MKLLLKTKILMTSMILLLGVTIWDVTPRAPLRDSLPHIEAIGIKEISRIELTSMGSTITLEKQSGEWVQIAPLSGLADVSRINSMILNFRKPIAMDVLVEVDPSDGGKSYGLDSSNAVTVEFWTADSEMPQVSFCWGMIRNLEPLLSVYQVQSLFIEHMLVVVAVLFTKPEIG